VSLGYIFVTREFGVENIDEGLEISYNLCNLPKQINVANGKTYMEDIFFHRTNWNGKAINSSQGCLIIDARSWRQVEQQLGASSNIYLLLNRK
jgi:hypothetical protein